LGPKTGGKKTKRNEEIKEMKIERGLKETVMNKIMDRHLKDSKFNGSKINRSKMKHDFGWKD
jgi:hypothetical protein